MIKVDKLDNNYYRCNACMSENNVNNISYGSNVHFTSCFRLCMDCRKLLIELLNNSLESEVE